jgi:hypothetical protein
MRNADKELRLSLANYTNNHTLSRKSEVECWQGLDIYREWKSGVK